MLIVWSKFIPALLVLLPPIALFHGRRVRYRTMDHDWSGYWRRTLSLELHWIDLGRAFLGTLWLSESFVTLPTAAGPLRHTALLIQAGVLVVAILLQTLVCKEPDSANAPFAFVVGVVAGFLPPLTAGFSLCLALALAMGVRSPAAFFPLLAVAEVVIGIFLAGMSLVLPLAVVGTVTTLPWLITLLFPRSLVSTHVVHRATRDEPPEPAPR